VDRLDQIPAALSAGADVILLDNFTVRSSGGPWPDRRPGLHGGQRRRHPAAGCATCAGLGLDFVSSGAPGASQRLGGHRPRLATVNSPEFIILCELLDRDPAFVSGTTLAASWA